MVDRDPGSLVRPINIRFDDRMFWVELSDGRVLGVPLSWFPVLAAATPSQRLAFTLSLRGLHWDEIDEDISVDGLLAGRGDMTNRGRKMAEAKLAEQDAASKGGPDQV
jgi:Protein of unknown function (DUF2442)